MGLISRAVVGVAVLVLPLTASAASVSVFESGYKDGVFEQRLKTARFTRSSGTKAPGFDLDPDQRFQRIRGFGAALTESCSMNLMRLAPEARHELLDRLFRKGGGAGFDLVRLPAGASDFADGAKGSYTYDDSATPDPDFIAFDVSRDRKSFELLREARRINPRLGVMMSPWSAPAWMKDSNNIHGGGLKPEHYADYARYLVKVLEAYRWHGVKVESLTIQNEPYYSTAGYPSMSLDTNQQIDFIGNHLGPLLRERMPRMKLFAIDHNWDLKDEAAALLSNPLSAPYLRGTAYHCYGGDPSDMKSTLEKFPRTETIQTECTGYDAAWNRDPQSFEGDFGWWLEAQSLGAVAMGTSGAMGWNLCLDEKHGPQNGFKGGDVNGGCEECRGLVTIDFSAPAPTLTFNPEFHALEQVSRFVHRGARRIGVTGAIEGLSVVAFRNPGGRLVFVAHNLTAAPIPFQLRDGSGRALDYELAAGNAVTLSW